MGLRVAEFYSGIGGMHFALQEARIESQVVRAFDINTVANHVYKHNFPSVPIMQRSIESLPMTLFEALKADLWTMSPPCQPYTRQGLQKGSEDARAQSFLFIVDLLGRLKNKPPMVLLENVAGFEKSDTRPVFLRQLVRLGYRFEEYLLNPLQLCYPNSRTRYYLLAKLDSETKECSEDEDFPPHFRHDVADEMAHYRLNSKVLEKHGYVHDVVTPEDRRTCCFTKGYTHYAEGTGSILQLEGVVGKDPITLENTRYFTPREVANLMGFPKNFSFPADTSIRQGYRLLGNSLSVSVVAVLMDYLVRHM
ncbi:S-adenosyl-L-methionine-dependent methyltransferase [Coemansia spiralis]|nr:S-adenosyl-L-methionine-dependent methyltransferase [Coemansia spiralis]